MKIPKVIEGGLTGVATLGMLQEALHRADHKSPRPFMHSDVLKTLRKNKEGAASSKLFIRAASELLADTALFGFSAIGKKKNAVLRGGLVGAGAGLLSAFLT